MLEIPVSTTISDNFFLNSSLFNISSVSCFILKKSNFLEKLAPIFSIILYPSFLIGLPIDVVFYILYFLDIVYLKFLI